MAQRQDVETRFLMTAQDRASAVLAGVRGELNKVGLSVGSVKSALATLGVGLTAGAFAAFVKSGIDAADSLAKTAQRVGVTVESLSALQYAASLSDVSVEQLQSGLAKLARAASDAASGSKEQAEAFSALGISVKDSAGALRGTEDLLLTIAEKFSGLQDGAAKTALAMRIFGRSGAEMLPYLNLGRDGIEQLREEAQRLGIIVSTDTAKAAEQFNDNLTRLGKSADGLKFSLANNLLPSLVRLTDRLADVVRNGEGAIGVLKSLTALSPFGDLQRAERELVEVTDRLVKNEDKLSKLGTSSFAVEAATVIEQKIADDKRRAQELIKLLGVLRGETDAFGQPVKPKSETKKPDAPTLQDTSNKQDPGQAFIEQLQKRLVSIEQNEFAVLRLEAAQKKVSSTAEPLIQQLERETEFRKQLAEAQQRDAQAAEAELSRRQGLVNGVGDYVKELNQETALMKLSNEQRLVAVQLLRLEEAGLQRNTEEYQAAKRAIEEAVDANSAAKIFEETRTPLERYQAQLKRLNDLADRGAIDWDTYERAVRRAEDELNEFGKTVEETKSLSEELGPVLSSSFEDAAFSGKKLGDVIKGLGEDIARLLFRRNVTKPLVDAIGGFDWGSIFSSLFASANGNIMTARGPMALQTFAGGGIASSPTLALYGEGSMNEAIIPLPDGRNVPVVLRGGGGRGPIVNVNIENRVADVTATAGRARTDSNGAITIDVIIDRLEPILGRRIQQGGGLAPVLERQYGLSRAAGAYR